MIRARLTNISVFMKVTRRTRPNSNWTRTKALKHQVATKASFSPPSSAPTFQDHILFLGPVILRIQPIYLTRGLFTLFPVSTFALISCYFSSRVHFPSSLQSCFVLSPSLDAFSFWRGECHPVTSHGRLSAPRQPQSISWQRRQFLRSLRGPTVNHPLL